MGQITKAVGAEDQTKKVPFSVAITSEGYQTLISRTLTDPKRCARFIANISTAVGNNPALQECSPKSILTAGLQAEVLGLSLNPNLKQAHLVPFKKKDKMGNVIEVLATFQVGYVGFKQMAMRSGQYKHFNALEIKEGELVNYDRLTEDIELKFIKDDEEREKAETIGYVATFELINGFKKTIYWSKKKMIAHAKRYSQAYNSDLRYNGTSSFWTTAFDEMGKKTMTKQLLSKDAILSIEMQMANTNDMGYIKDIKKDEVTGDSVAVVEYVDNPENNEVVVEETPKAETPKTAKKESKPTPTQQAEAQPTPDIPEDFGYNGLNFE